MVGSFAGAVEPGEVSTLTTQTTDRAISRFLGSTSCATLRLLSESHVGRHSYFTTLLEKETHDDLG